MFRSLVKKIEEHGKNYHRKEDDKRNDVNDARIDIFSTDLIRVIFYEGVGQVCFT